MSNVHNQHFPVWKQFVHIESKLLKNLSDSDELGQPKDFEEWEQKIPASKYHLMDNFRIIIKFVDGLDCKNRHACQEVKDERWCQVTFSYLANSLFVNIVVCFRLLLFFDTYSHYVHSHHSSSEEFCLIVTSMNQAISSITLARSYPCLRPFL